MTLIKNQVANKVSEIYSWLDSQLLETIGLCEICGKCCDFAGFGHKLFVSTPELIYLDKSVNIRPMLESRCPYQVKENCGIHKHRFAACRIFFCKGNKDFQSRLSEEVLRKFKSLCIEFHLPWHYAELADALNNNP